MPKKKKLIKKHTPEEYLFNPIYEMLEAGHLEDFPGCCGISVLSDFPDDDLCHELADEANRIEEENAANDSEWNHESLPVSESRADIRAHLFREAPMILATTIFNQQYANRVLPLLGFTVQQTFKGRGRNMITLWILRKN